MIFLLLILMILVIADVYVAETCLKMITHPIRRSEEDMRKAETDDGFADCIDAYENKWERQSFEIENDGAVLSGEIIKNPEGEKDKVAIIAHGHTANRYASLKYADMFYRLGYNVVIYDERYFGRSTGGFCTLGQKEADDLSKVFSLVRERFGQDCRIAVHGESMGAATSLMVLKKEKPQLVVADCPFCDSKRLFDEYVVNNLHVPPVLVIPLVILLGKLQYKYYIREVSPIEAVRNSDVPICFMHGDADKLIDCDHSKQMFKVCKNPKSEMHLFEGAGHAMSVVLHRQLYEKLLRDFVMANE